MLPKYASHYRHSNISFQQFERLYRHRDGSRFTNDLLKFIDNELLRMEPKKRASCARVVKAFEHVHKRCVDDPDYCVKNLQIPPSRARTNSSLLLGLRTQLTPRIKGEIWEQILRAKDSRAHQILITTADDGTTTGRNASFHVQLPRVSPLMEENTIPDSQGVFSRNGSSPTSPRNEETDRKALGPEPLPGEQLGLPSSRDRAPNEDDQNLAEASYADSAVGYEDLQPVAGENVMDQDHLTVPTNTISGRSSYNTLSESTRHQDREVSADISGKQFVYESQDSKGAARSWISKATNSVLRVLRRISCV